MKILTALVFAIVFSCAGLASAQEPTPSGPQIPAASTPSILMVLNKISERGICTVGDSEDGTYTQVLWCQDGIGTIQGVSGYELYGTCTALSSTIMLLVNSFFPFGVKDLNVTLGFDGTTVLVQFGSMNDLQYTSPWLPLGRSCEPDTVNK